MNADLFDPLPINFPITDPVREKYKSEKERLQLPEALKNWLLNSNHHLLTARLQYSCCNLLFFFLLFSYD